MGLVASRAPYFSDRELCDARSQRDPWERTFAESHPVTGGREAF